MIIKQTIRNGVKFYKPLGSRSFYNLAVMLNKTEDSGPKVIKENIKNRFEEREEKTTFPYSEKRFQKEEYGASKVEAQTPFELFCKEFKESSSKVPTTAEEEMKYFQNAWAELDENAKENYVKLFNIEKESKSQEDSV